LMLELAGQKTEAGPDRILLANIIPEIADLPTWEDIPQDGVRLQKAANSDLHFKGQNAFAIDTVGAGDGGLELILVDWTFGTEELSAYSACLQELEPEPCATLHTRDAADLKFNDGDRIVIATDSGSLELILRVADNMASGILLIPRHRQLDWQIFGTGRVIIGKERIKKVASD